MIVAPSSTQTSMLRAPRGLTGALTWRLVLVRDAEGSPVTVVIAESSDEIVSNDIGDHRHLRYDRPYTSPADDGTYRAIWARGCEEVFETVVVADSSSATFATLDDVAHRRGLAGAGDLTAEQTASIEFLLPMAAAVIADAAGKDDGWAVTLAPVPQILKGLSVELVLRALANPDSVQAQREQLGQYSISQNFAAGQIGMALSDTEVLIVRRAVHGRTSGSVRVESSLRITEVLLWEQRQIAQGTA